MDRLSNCVICHSSKMFIRFNCNHEICSQCIHLQILRNFPELKNLKEIDHDVTYKCIKCQIGKASISSFNLSRLIESVSKDNTIIESNECNLHNKIFKSICKTCTSNLCVICYDEHDELGHEIINIKHYHINMGNHCEEHKDKLTLYCNSCDKTICNICYEFKHLNHNTTFTCEYFATIKKELNSVRMPYNAKTFDLFLQKFTYEENLFLKQMHIEHEDIKKNISELVVYLNDINHSFQIKFHKLENDLRFNCQLIKQLFKNYYQDINKIVELDYQRLEYLNKLPKIFGDFIFDSNTNNQVFSDRLYSFKENLSKLKDESKFMSYKIDDTSSIKCIQKLDGHTDWVLSLLQIKNGMIASGSADKSIRLWDRDTTQIFKCIQTLEGHSNYVWCLLELNNGVIASGSSDKSIKIWDPTQNFKCIHTLEGHTNSVLSLIQLQNGFIASGGADKTIKIWDPTQNFKCIYTLEGHYNYVSSLIQLKKGLIASGSHDKNIKIWDPTEKFKCIQTLEGHSDVVRSLLQLKNGLMVSGSHDKSIKIWDTAVNFKCIRKLEGHTGWVYTLLQLNNGLIISSSQDKSIKIWNPNENFKCINTLEENSSDVSSLVQFKNGLIGSGSADMSIKIWE